MARRGKARYAYEPDYAVPPGATLQETIAALDMTQRDLARRTGMSTKTINEIIKGKAPVTPGTSVLLERVTGVPTRMWNNLEANYREQLAKITDRERQAVDLKWLKMIPTRELIKRGIIEPTQDKVALLQEVLRFFGVASSAQWHEVWPQLKAAYRKSKKFSAEPGAVATWLRLGELEALEIRTKPYEKTRFRSAIQKIRKLTTKPPGVFQPRMVELAAAAGVAIVFVPEIKKCPVSGVARWLTPEKALIQLSLRYKTDDQFWFSFFHEAGHIMNDAKKEVFIDDGGLNNEREKRADRFAANTLIPAEHARTLPTLKTRGAIVAFAEQVGIAPGIVLGRLQKEKHVPWGSYMNDLKHRFEWKVA